MNWAKTSWETDALSVGVFSLLLFLIGFEFFPTVPFPYLTATRLLVLGGIVLWLLQSLSRRHWSLPRSGLELPIAGILVAALLSTIVSPNQAEAFAGLRQFGEDLAVFYLAIHYLTNASRLKLLLVITLVIGAAIALWGSYEGLAGVPTGFYLIAADGSKLVQSSLLDPFTTATHGVVRATASFTNPDILGGYLTLLLPLALAWAIQPGLSRTERVLACVMLLIMIAGVYFTYSRAAWIASLVGCGFLLTLVWPRRRIARTLAIVIPLLLGAVVLIAPLRHRLESLLIPDARLVIWRKSLGMLWHNHLLGVGLRNYSSAYVTYTGTQVYNAHSMFLQFGVELGILGFLALIWLLVTFFRNSRRSWKEASALSSHIFLAGFISAIAALQLHGLFDAVYNWEPIGELFWLILGFSIAAMRLLKQAAIEARQSAIISEAQAHLQFSPDARSTAIEDLAGVIALPPSSLASEAQE